MIKCMREECPGLENTKDIVYILCTIIQTVMAIIAFVYVYLWWERKKRKDDQRREDEKQEMENREKKMEREKARKVIDLSRIASILGEKFDNVEIIFYKLKRRMNELKNNTVNGNFTEFDVLLYMYHRNVLHEGETVNSHVNQIMKLFVEFRVQLSTIEDKECPEHIKEEFSSEIIEMGKTIYPFVSKHRQKTIEKVLKYFDYPPNTTQVSNTAAVEENPSSDTNKRCTLLSSNQGASFQSAPSTSQAVPEERGGGEASTVRSASADKGLIPYPGHDAIINTIPYIDHFQYVDGEMKCNLECRYSAIKTLDRHVQQKTASVMEKEQEIKKEIRRLWSSHSPKTAVPNDDFLHLIRMVMYELKSFGVEAIKLFDEYVRTVVNDPVNCDKVIIIETCTRTLGDLISIADSLPGDRTAHLLEYKDTAEFLQSQVNALRDFVKDRLSRQAGIQQN